jgi:hypothetical protein
MAVLTRAQRNNLPKSDFALPDRRMYPVEDLGHARAAIMRVMQHGTPDEKYAVRKAVYSMYPQLIPHSRLNLYAKAPRTRRGEITGKLNLINFMQKENAEGRKVKVFYAGMDKGRPSYRYESWGIRPHLKEVRTAMLAREKTPYKKEELRIGGFPSLSTKIDSPAKFRELARKNAGKKPDHVLKRIEIPGYTEKTTPFLSPSLDSPAAFKRHAQIESLKKLSAMGVPGAKEKLEMIETPHGNVSFRETKNPKRGQKQKIFVPGAPNIQRHGTELGAGVYRDGKRQHINLEG